MRGRRTCSKCGLACYTTWKGDNTKKPAVLCKACLSSEKKALGDQSQYHGLARAQSFEINSPLQRRVSPNETSTTLHCGIETRSAAHKGKSSSLWDPRILQKRRRSKPPKCVLSPMGRFANELLRATRFTNDIPENQDSRWLHSEKQEYDDDFIYEKCKLISHNEIGLGATLLAPPVPLTKHSRPDSGQARTEPYSDGGCASSVLFDVPKRGFSA